MTDWQERLRTAGYIGGFDIASLDKEIRKYMLGYVGCGIIVKKGFPPISDEEAAATFLAETLERGIPPVPEWQTKLRAAGYTGKLELGAMVRALPQHENYEEAVANLMIQHPELWKK